jgi:hypothetical protein
MALRCGFGTDGLVGVGYTQRSRARKLHVTKDCRSQTIKNTNGQNKPRFDTLINGYHDLCRWDMRVDKLRGTLNMGIRYAIRKYY